MTVNNEIGPAGSSHNPANERQIESNSVAKSSTGTTSTGRMVSKKAKNVRISNQNLKEIFASTSLAAQESQIIRAARAEGYSEKEAFERASTFVKMRNSQIPLDNQNANNQLWNAKVQNYNSLKDRKISEIKLPRSQSSQSTQSETGSEDDELNVAFHEAIKYDKVFIYNMFVEKLKKIEAEENKIKDKADSQHKNQALAKCQIDKNKINAEYNKINGLLNIAEVIDKMREQSSVQATDGSASTKTAKQEVESEPKAEPKSEVEPEYPPPAEVADNAVDAVGKSEGQVALPDGDGLLLPEDN